MTARLVHDTQTCGARTRSGSPCALLAGWGTDHVGEGRCKLHGGKSLAGPASPNWSHGRHSIYRRRLGAGTRPDFDEAMVAPDPLLLLEELALARALVGESLAGLSEQGREMAVGELRAVAALLDEGEAKERLLALAGCLQLDRGGEVLQRVDAVRKLAETSARVMDMRANSFTRVQSLALIARMVELIAANVHDPQDRRRTLTALTTLTSEVAPAQVVGQ